MAKWQFWGDKEFSDVYENIYIRTFMQDWFNIVKGIAKESSGKKNILDIGCGEGHTTKQILDRIEGSYICDLLEPNKNALTSAKSFLSQENNIGESFTEMLADFNPNKKYDLLFTSHTNYYWATNEDDYKGQLKKLMNMLNEGGKLLILTLPEKSDHYNIMLRQIYPKFNYSEYIIGFYKELEYNVEVKKFRMRIYIGDIVENKKIYDLKNFYRFIHNTESYPDDSENEKFLAKIKKYQKENYLDFKDNLIIVSKS